MAIDKLIEGIVLPQHSQCNIWNILFVRSLLENLFVGT